MSDTVAAVKPADLKSLWRMVSIFQAISPSGSLATRTLEEACSEGADIEAIYFRATMLSKMPGMLAPWTHNDELDDVVFKVAAAFPMRKINADVIERGCPFDPQELLMEIKEANQGLKDAGNSKGE
jgi:hypothetical protein